MPERTCAACRRKRSQPEFVRLTRTPQGWQILAGRRQGRGAYLCADSPACWQEKKLRRAFGGQAARLAAELARTGPVQTGPADGAGERPTSPPARQSAGRDTL